MTTYKITVADQNGLLNQVPTSIPTLQTAAVISSPETVYANAVADAAVGAAALYQTTAGLSANVLTLSSNNTTFFNGVTLSSVNNAITSNAATSYANAVAFASNASNITTGTLSFSVMNSNVVSNAQLQSNLSNYQTTAGLSANVLVLTANAASFLGNSSGTIANVASWITGNSASAYSNAVANAAALYQTTAGLSANVATLTANNANNLGGAVAASYVNTSGAYTITGIHTHNANVFVNTASLLVGNATINTSITGATILINGVNVNTAITGNAATAYANAVFYAANELGTLLTVPGNLTTSLHALTMVKVTGTGNLTIDSTTFTTGTVCEVWNSSGASITINPNNFSTSNIIYGIGGGIISNNAIALIRSISFAGTPTLIISGGLI